MAARALADLRARRQAADAESRTFERYHDDPVGFARDVLGLTIWPRQAEILEAIRDHDNVAVRSGHKVGKTSSAIAVAVWFVCTRKRARVILTSSSDDQIRHILWKELARLYDPVKARIGGDRALDHRTGLRFPDGREIIGLATKKPENMAGFSSPEMLLIADEASGIDDLIFEAVEGNRAGGARLALFSNPTRTSGKFYRAFHDDAEHWRRIHVSSEEAAATGIPGLATREYVEGRKAEWGQASPIYQVRVEGNFAEQNENAVIGLTLVSDAIKRWATTPETGELHIGVDPARFGDDDTVIWPRRGNKALQSIIVSKLDEAAVAKAVVGAVKRLRKASERVTVNVDGHGLGSGVISVLRNHESRREYTVCDIRSGEPSDDPDRFFNLRSQLAFGVADWLHDGGAIPDDAKLQAELVAAIYGFDTRARLKLESKDEIKKRLGRSPDRADALALAIYTGRGSRVLLPTKHATPYRLGGQRGF